MNQWVVDFVERIKHLATIAAAPGFSTCDVWLAGLFTPGGYITASASLSRRPG